MHYRKDEMVIEMSERSGIVFVGNKMPMDYVLAIITGLSASDTKGITLKARGQAITTAVDAAEITRRRFLKDLKVSKIVIEQKRCRQEKATPEREWFQQLKSRLQKSRKTPIPYFHYFPV